MASGSSRCAAASPRGLWEETVGGAVKSYYTLNGTLIALRDSGANVVTYLHGDHLGSVSLATSASGQGTPQVAPASRVR